MNSILCYYIYNCNHNYDMASMTSMTKESTASTASTASTFRFKYSFHFQNMLNGFASKNADKPKKEFDECFNKWCIQNERYINEERSEMVNKGYNRDFNNKIYLSVRYYFRNKHKSCDGKGKGESADQGKGKLKYVKLSNTFKTLMKNHIYDNKGGNKSPKEMFALFYNSDNDEIQKFIQSETNKLRENGYSEKDILFRIKKMYKNLYFVTLRRDKKNKEQ